MHQISYQDLIRKIEQQEATLTQLIKIIAATNHKVSNLQEKQIILESSLTIKSRS